MLYFMSRKTVVAHPCVNIHVNYLLNKSETSISIGERYRSSD